MANSSDRLLLGIILVLTIISAVFCVIGLATPGWGGGSVFKWRQSTGALIVVSLILLIVVCLLAIIIFTGSMQIQQLPLIYLALLILASLFLLGALGAFSSYYGTHIYYSYNLLITAFSLTYISSILATYWFCKSGGFNTQSVGPRK